MEFIWIYIMRVVVMMGEFWVVFMMRLIIVLMMVHRMRCDGGGLWFLCSASESIVILFGTIGEGRFD